MSIIATYHTADMYIHCHAITVSPEYSVYSVSRRIDMQSYLQSIRRIRVCVQLAYKCTTNTAVSESNRRYHCRSLFMNTIRIPSMLEIRQPSVI